MLVVSTYNFFLPRLEISIFYCLYLVREYRAKKKAIAFLMTTAKIKIKRN